MNHYRLYIIGSHGRIAKAIDLHYPDDDVAERAANRQPHSNGMELWSGPRKVRVFPKVPSMSNEAA